MDYKELINRLRCDLVCSSDIKEAAADAIETLLKERDKAWISVKDQPKKSMANKVLVYCQNRYIGFGHYEVFKGRRYWVNLENGRIFLEENKVTHWMPLPEPPHE